MLEQNPFSEASLTESFGMADLLALAEAKLEKLHSLIIYEFGPNGIYIMGAFSGFIILILLIYIKSVIDTFRIAAGESAESGLFYTEEGASASSSQDFADDENEDFPENSRPRLTINPQEADISSPEGLRLEQEKELSRKLVISSATTDDILQLKEKLKKQFQQNNENRLDWQKDVHPAYEELNENTALNYQQQRENVNELISLIINMLSREVSTEKIAQAVYYRNQGQTEKEEILQTISAVRDFISLCNTGKFDNLPARSELPTNEEAILAWAGGDNSYCLNLLENLIKQQIDNADTKDGTVKELNYAQAASYACIFGTIAGPENAELAQNSFELALELAPQSTNAWSRCGDIYWHQGSYDKAVYAYQTVVETGDENLYAQQIANARHKLALYYSENGKSDAVSSLEHDSSAYYQNSGITTALTSKENEVLSFIAENQQQNLLPAVGKLLQNRQSIYM